MQTRRVMTLLLIAAVSSAGCSALLVDRPPPQAERLRSFDCTSSRVLPGVDAVMAAALLVLHEPNAATSDRVSSGAMAAGFAASAAWGFSHVHHCRAQKDALALRLQQQAVAGSAPLPSAGHPAPPPAVAPASAPLAVPPSVAAPPPAPLRLLPLKAYFPPPPPLPFSLGVRMGALLPLSLRVDDVVPQLGVYLLGWHPGGPLVEAFAETTIDEKDVAARALGLGLGLPLLHTDAGDPLFLSLGTQVSWRVFGGRRVRGLTLRPGLGFVFGLQRRLRLRFDVAYFVDFTKEQPLDRLTRVPPEPSRAHGALLLWGVGL